MILALVLSAAVPTGILGGMIYGGVRAVPFYR